MSPFVGNPMGFSPATLALLDAAFTDMYADFQREMSKAPNSQTPAAPVASKIDISRNDVPKRLARTVVQKRSATKTSGNLRFNDVRGWYLR